MSRRLLHFILLGGLAFSVPTCASSKRKANSFTSGSSGRGQESVSQAYRELNVREIFIPSGRYGRWKYRPMRPRYITIHSTQNPTGDAWAHARALSNGKLRAKMRPGGNRIGYLTWHFTVQDDVCVQHLPTNEQGEHADFDGPGNNYSIGIEMCEHRGDNRAATIERTAKLAAVLMHRYGIPLNNVVPHYHWPREGANPPNKNCPDFLMDNGRPGPKWRDFLRKVNKYYRQMG